jgi:threonine/homoserine/homoserine lactone efflux protein
MPATSTIALFLVAALALLLTPGPAVLYIVARSVEQGRRAGLASVAGVGVGGLFHVGAAALGLSALLLSSALAFAAVKYLGAAYLVYLGLRTLLAREPAHDTVAVERQPLGRIFSQGVVVNILNPKAALFFFAFLPQFVDPARGATGAQVLFFGLAFVLLALFTDGSYALLAGSLANWLRGNRRFLQAQRYFAGGIYIALGLTTALSGSTKAK